MIIPQPSLGANNPSKARFSQLVTSIGRAALNSLFPDDFEYYVCSLELVKSTGDGDETVEFFVFPIMPTSISQSEPKIVNIKKSQGGITTLNTNTFQPIDISLKGDFGRRLKVLVGGNLKNFSGISFENNNLKGNLSQVKKAAFDTKVKTGYGCMKIIQKMIRKSTQLDAKGNPYKLFFYNPSIGDNFLVQPLSADYAQSYGRNMIWTYNINFKAIAPAEGILSEDAGKSSLSKTLTVDVLNKVVNSQARVLKQDIFALTNKIQNLV